jgi:hypothetical protein
MGLAGCASAKKQASTDTHGAAAAAQSMARAKAAAAAAAPAPKAALAEEAKISCTKASETRTLEIVKKGPGCELEYLKSGKTSSVATSTHGLKHCVDSEKKIRSKLDQAGFKCT